MSFPVSVLVSNLQSPSSFESGRVDPWNRLPTPVLSLGVEGFYGNLSTCPNMARSGIIVVEVHRGADQVSSPLSHSPSRVNPDRPSAHLGTPTHAAHDYLGLGRPLSHPHRIFFSPQSTFMLIPSLVHPNPVASTPQHSHSV
ncbi:hypothetical protein Pcinc_035396 [Petrolisthes cinctipes]|uniref:Uncharacterized protein n=1 Tax=Petrolisthes cinctipes TaxID=88211 RepID=A0AAE1BWM6_PETCI|nr:hypothetical protein Pcinc_035396 [Petrolisthes cinctipes]